MILFIEGGHMKSLCLWLLVVLSVTTSASAQRPHPGRDTVSKIKTSAGATLLGTIQKETEDSIYFRTTDGVNMQLPRSSVAAIEYKTAALPKHWSEFGGAIGTPAGVNFVVGARWPTIGIRLSGGFWGESLYGAQIAVPLTLARSEYTTHAIAPFITTSHIVISHENVYYSSYGYGYIDEPSTHTWTGLGVAYELNTHGFDLEAGLDVGSGSYSNPQFDIQIGYVVQNK